MPVNGRRKGNKFESDVCKLLSGLFGGKFKRRSMGQAGDDIIDGPPGFTWSVECKHRKTMRVRHFFQPTVELTGWWKQAKDQAAEAGKCPMLILKAEGIIFMVTSANLSYGHPHILCDLDGDRVKVTQPMGFCAVE